MDIQHPYLLFLGDVPDRLSAKTALGIAQWRPEWCLGQWRSENCQVDLGLPDLSLQDAKEKGARTLVIGVANRGGILADHWQTTLLEALSLGYDIANGLHQRLIDLPALVEAARSHGCRLFDVRHPPEDLPIGSGAKRPGKRLLAVGTDCSVGKMYSTLALEKEMRARGLKADFRATGQTGILISGRGVSIDAVVADFISGATETISPANDPEHWDLIEGQGSLFHPSFAGVSLGLLHGAQADALLMCHVPERPHMRGLPDYALPDLADCFASNLHHAQRVNPQARFVGIAVNSAAMSEKDAKTLTEDLSARYNMPCVDPVRHGVAEIVDVLENFTAIP